MAAPTILQVLEAIETALETIPGLRTSEFVPDSGNPPQAVVDWEGEIDYHGTAKHGMQIINCSVIIIVSRASDRAGNQALAGYASATGTNSIHAAIEADATLGGVVDDCNVVGFRRLSSEEVAGLNYYGGVFTLSVIAKGI